ncbi:MAG: zinc ribbon domain-containing protein [Candidatus Caldarchaeum sp.]
MKTLTAGYLLSAFHALNFTPAVFVTFYPSLVTFPASIILRGVGWRRLKPRISDKASVSYVIWAFGLLTYIFLLLELTEVIEGALMIAAISWTIYSLAEAFLYLSAASIFNILVFRISPISLAAVAVIDFLVLTRQVAINMPSSADPIVQLIYVAAALLFVSAVSAGYASSKITPIERSLTPRKHAYLPPGSPTVETRKTTSREVAKPQLKVIRSNSYKICPSCRHRNPVETDFCTTCGAYFEVNYSGLACPICSAPLSMAKSLANRRYLCGVCASTIELTR